MMPVAGQDAVLDAAPIERETHMRAAIVEREDMAALVHEKDRAMAAVHNKPALGFQLLKGAARARNPRSWYPSAPHPTRVRRSAIQQGPSPNVNPAVNLSH